eukprot:m51a1_g7013 hypothetical protein (159) ;mRNA; f:9112-9588
MRVLLIACFVSLSLVGSALSERARFTIQSRSSGRYLDGRDPNMTQPWLTDRLPQNDPYLQWEFVPVTDGRFAIQSSSSRGFLDGRDMRDPLITYRQPTPSNVYLQWSLVPVSHASDVALLSRGSGGYLDGRDAGMSDPWMAYRPAADDRFLHWIVKPL